MPTRRRGKKSCHDPTANWNALEFIPQPYLRLVAMPAWSHSTAREMAVGPTEVRDCAETLVGARGLEPAIPTTRIVVPSWAVNALPLWRCRWRITTRQPRRVRCKVATSPFQDDRRGARITVVSGRQRLVYPKGAPSPCKASRFLDKRHERDTRHGDGIRILRHVRHTAGRGRSEVLRRLRVTTLTCGFISTTGAARPRCAAAVDRRSAFRRAASRRLVRLVRAARSGISAGLSRRAVSRLHGLTCIRRVQCPRRDGQGLQDAASCCDAPGRPGHRRAGYSLIPGRRPGPGPEFGVWNGSPTRPSHGQGRRRTHDVL